jgi:protein AbiQ
MIKNIEEKLKLYYVTDEYVDYISKFEMHVWNNSDKGNQRPYVGIVIELNGYKYYAPLTSAKAKYEKWKDSLTTIRIEYKSEFLAILCLNNMIPVSDKDITLVDIVNCTDTNYKNILNKEMIGIRNKQDKIVRTAKNLYNEISKKDNPKPLIKRIRKVCFDFSMLEMKYKEYNE